jgi:PAS domain S-box-containing protein
VFPLRTQWVGISVLLVVITAGASGWIAYDVARDTIERNATEMVWLAARSREEALISLLERRDERARALLRDVEFVCADRGAGARGCREALLEAFASIEGIVSARLSDGRDEPIIIGKPYDWPAGPPAVGILAEFTPLAEGQRSYLTDIQEGPLRLTLLWHSSLVEEIFEGAHDLGGTGETFLADPRGFFITAPAYGEAHQHNGRIDALPMETCLSGRSGQMIAPDYRGVEAIHSFRYLPQIGGGCIMAHIGVAEAMAPTRALAQRMLLLAAVLAGLAALVAALVARRSARALRVLTQRARALQAGDFSKPIPIEGPAELRTFASTFAQMSRSLRESETRNRAVLENALDSVVGMNASGLITDWNAQAEATFGWRREEVIGRRMDEVIIPPQHRAAHARGLQRFLDTGKSEILGRRIELNALTRDGREIPVELSITTPTLGGEPVFYAFVRDLTEAKRMEAERARLERLSATVNDNATVAMFLMDARQHCTYMNPAAEAMTGFTLAEVQGKPLHEFVHHTRPDGRPYPLHECPIDRALPERSREAGEEIFIRKDGSFFHVSFTASPILDGDRAVGTVIEVRDITDEKRAQGERDFLSQTSEMLSASLEFEVTLANVARAAVPRLGDFCSVQMLGDDGEVQRYATAYADPQKEASVAEALRDHIGSHGLPVGTAQVLACGQPQLVPELPADLLSRAAADNLALAPLLDEVRPVSFMGVPMRARGRVIGVISFITSARSRRRFDGRDLALAEEFVRRCTLALENARLFQQAQEAVALRDEFLSIASHELKTPLTPLQLQLQLFARQAAQYVIDPAQRQRFEDRLQGLQRQGARIQRLVDELLDLSRITLGKLQLELEPVDLAEVVRDAIAACDLETSQGRAADLMDVAVEPGIVGNWDRLRVQQVAVNLLSNALKYGQGKPVSVRIARDGDYAVLSVQDHGIGIAQEDHGRIFGRLERAVSARNYGGLGLGLYITRQAVEAMGGEIGVESAPGEGAIFTVRLPVGGKKLPGESEGVRAADNGA